MRGLTIVSRGMVLLALPAFCFSAVAIFGSFWGVLLGFGTPAALLGLVAAIALPVLSIFGPVQSRREDIPALQKWLWVLSPTLPLAILLTIMAEQ